MENIKQLQDILVRHSIYKSLENIENLKIFMQYHVYAVFDFMSLLKSLQNKIAPANNLWTPSPYPGKVVRFINEITIAEESDEMPDGSFLSHFEMYLKAMEELSIDTKNIRTFVSKYIETNKLDFELLPNQVKGFVVHNLDTALNGNLEQVLGSFLFGREKLIPEMFSPILKAIKSHLGEDSLCAYYFQRHIDIDGDEHGPMAQFCFENLCSDQNKKDQALLSAEIALAKRVELWDQIYSEIKKSANISGRLQARSI